MLLTSGSPARSMLKMKRGVHAQISYTFYVLQRIYRTDGKLSTEIATNAEQLDHIELSAQPA